MAFNGLPITNSQTNGIFDGMGYGANIEAARRKAGLSQAELAQKLGKYPSAVSGWENDKFSPSIDYLVAISDATGASLDELIRGIEPQPVGEILTDDEQYLVRVYRSLSMPVDLAVQALSAATSLMSPPGRYPLQPSSPPPYADDAPDPPLPSKNTKRRPSS